MPNEHPDITSKIFPLLNNNLWSKNQWHHENILIQNGLTTGYNMPKGALSHTSLNDFDCKQSPYSKVTSVWLSCSSVWYIREKHYSSETHGTGRGGGTLARALAPPPPTVVCVSGLSPGINRTSCVGRVCCWYSSLFREVVSGFFSFPSPQKLTLPNFQFDMEHMDMFMQVKN